MPSRDLHFRIESRPRSATLYVSGTLTAGGAVLALRSCYTLPTEIAELRVDLRSATIEDATSLQTVALLLGRWRRAGADRHSRIDLPPVARRPAPQSPPLRNSPARKAPRPRVTTRGAAGATGSVTTVASLS